MDITRARWTEQESFWISLYGECRHLSPAESFCPVTLLQLRSGQLLEAIGMEWLLSTHRNLLLPGNIWTDFWPCLFTLLSVAWTAAECITTLTITTGAIMNNDEIRISLCRCNSYHLLVGCCLLFFLIQRQCYSTFCSWTMLYKPSACACV